VIELTHDELFDKDKDARWATSIIVKSLGESKTWKIEDFHKDTTNYRVELKVNGVEMEPIDLETYMEDVSQRFMEQWRERYSRIEEEISTRVKERMDIIVDKITTTVEELKG
jgi:hypothetical protein